jgi:hypothetical protein
MIGALLLWINPALLWNGHCWPQWDVWMVPFFLGAVLLACVDWWFAAGLCVAIGACLKGQILLGAPVLLLWPLFSLRLGAAFRLVCGFVFALAMIALPWMHPPGAWAYVSFMLASVVIGIGVLVALRLKMPVRLKRLLPSAYALCVALLIFLMIPLFGASTSWYRLGFEYGAEKFNYMVTGSGSWNIGRMLRVYYGWPDRPDDPMNWPLVNVALSYRATMIVLYGICLVLCGIGAAAHFRRRDPRFLAAMVAPWLCFFMILAQMHGRYTVWAAAFGSLLAGVGPGMTLLAILVSVLSTLGQAQNQYVVMGYPADWLPTVVALDPHGGWLLLFIAAIYLYVAAPGRVSPPGSS